jgi:hypothetical protein
MAIIPLYRDLQRALAETQHGQPVWPRFEAGVYLPHRAYFEGLADTYGRELYGPTGLQGTIEMASPMLRQALAPAATYGMEERAQRLMDVTAPLLPGSQPNLYLGTLLFMAPAATISVLKRPAMALGLERFHPNPPATGEKYLYHPDEVAEMIPHEAAHAARMQVLNLPPTPRQLSLLEMIMLEGTALTFTDLLLGKQTLSTFMPPERMAWHEANEQQVRATAAAEFGATGMEPFMKYFAQHSPVSGYYAGYSYCREYLQRYGAGAIRDLISLPSGEILRRLS